MMIYKRFGFDAAHFLPNVPEGHKCRNMHGHTYELIVYVEGVLLQPEGWVIDYGDLKQAVLPIISLVDHHCLNEIPGLENPTSEILAKWLFHMIEPLVPGLKRVELKETPTSGVIYEGE
jgi:6-pyruvoyltetrahydropterin/6-carboxytetrahydropterin synthase